MGSWTLQPQRRNMKTGLEQDSTVQLLQQLQHSNTLIPIHITHQTSTQLIVAIQKDTHQKPKTKYTTLSFSLTFTRLCILFCYKLLEYQTAQSDPSPTSTVLGHRMRLWSNLTAKWPAKILHIRLSKEMCLRDINQL